MSALAPSRRLSGSSTAIHCCTGLAACSPVTAPAGYSPPAETKPHRSLTIDLHPRLQPPLPPVKGPLPSSKFPSPSPPYHPSPPSISVVGLGISALTAHTGSYCLAVDLSGSSIRASFLDKKLLCRTGPLRLESSALLTFVLVPNGHHR